MERGAAPSSCSPPTSISPPVTLRLKSDHDEGNKVKKNTAGMKEGCRTPCLVFVVVKTTVDQVRHRPHRRQRLASNSPEVGPATIIWGVRYHHHIAPPTGVQRRRAPNGFLVLRRARPWRIRAPDCQRPRQWHCCCCCCCCCHCYCYCYLEEAAAGDVREGMGGAMRARRGDSCA